MARVSKKKYLETLDEISQDGCCNKDYCIFRVILESMSVDHRVLIQIKCVEKFKYEVSESNKRCVDWEEAFNLWIDKGYAKKFSDLYSEDKKFTTLYKEIIKEN